MGDSIYAIIHGSAVNQDGRSQGLTAPNGLAQERVIRQALDNAGCQPDNIGYVETHGTGTLLGDPIEIQALGQVLEGRKSDQPVILGALKSAIGHTEAAAGVLGLIKTTMAIFHGSVPGNLHGGQPKPKNCLAGG